MPARDDLEKEKSLCYTHMLPIDEVIFRSNKKGVRTVFRAISKLILGTWKIVVLPFDVLSTFWFFL